MYKDKEKQKEYMKRWQSNNPEKVAVNNKRWYENNKEQVMVYINKYRVANREKISGYYKKYNQIHKDDHNKKERDKYKTDLKFNLNDRMGRAIRLSLRGNKNGHKWEKLVGYTLADLIKHLERTLPEGYTWEECHIDHIIPISAFNFTVPEHTDFKRCWELNNLQLLPAMENLIKYSKLKEPFQPALLV